MQREKKGDYKKGNGTGRERTDSVPQYNVMRRLILVLVAAWSPLLEPPFSTIKASASTTTRHATPHRTTLNALQSNGRNTLWQWQWQWQ